MFVPCNKSKYSYEVDAYLRESTEVDNTFIRGIAEFALKDDQAAFGRSEQNTEVPPGFVPIVSGFTSACAVRNSNYECKSSRKFGKSPNQILLEFCQKLGSHGSNESPLIWSFEENTISFSLPNTLLSHTTIPTNVWESHSSGSDSSPSTTTSCERSFSFASSFACSVTNEVRATVQLNLPRMMSKKYTGEWSKTRKEAQRSAALEALRELGLNPNESLANDELQALHLRLQKAFSRYLVPKKQLPEWQYQCHPRNVQQFRAVCIVYPINSQVIGFWRIGKKSAQVSACRRMHTLLDRIGIP